MSLRSYVGHIQPTSHVFKVCSRFEFHFCIICFSFVLLRSFLQKIGCVHRLVSKWNLFWNKHTQSVWSQLASRGKTIHCTKASILLKTCWPLFLYFTSGYLFNEYNAIRKYFWSIWNNLTACNETIYNRLFMIGMEIDVFETVWLLIIYDSSSNRLLLICAQTK